MAWTSLSDTTRFTNLPEILCGPIVRKVTNKSVSVFIITKSALGSGKKIEIKNSNSNSVGTTRTMTSTVETKQMGNNLFVSMYTAEEPQGSTMTENSKYFYDIFLDTNKNLNKVGVLTNSSYSCSITYNNDLYPSFKTPPDNIKNVRLFHGSCRKMVGDGSDALAYIDKDMESNANNNEDRPQFLFMTGDQIYADDLSDSLLAMIIDAENKLIKPYNTDSAKQSVFHTDRAKLLPGQRRKYLRGERGLCKPLFDSGDIFSNQLLSFGEFMISYIMAWSDVLWPAKDTGETPDKQFFPNIYDIQGIVSSCIGNSQYNCNITRGDDDVYEITEEEYKQKCYKKHNTEISIFRKELQKVRRVLANIPTYMIFDDHEISDDWNISYFWYEKLKSKGTGLTTDSSTNPLKSFISNGMAAYAVMQDWGNQPELYLNTAKEHFKLLDSLEELINNHSTSNKTWKVDINDKIFPKYKQYNANKKNHGFLYYNFKWYFDMEFIDYRIQALDTRTLREFNKKKTKLINNQSATQPDPPLGDSSTNIYFDLQISNPNNKDNLILVAPCPIFSAVPRTGFMHFAQNVSKNFADYEARDNHGEFTNQVLHRLGQLFKNIVVLSGDVHYGYTIAMKLQTLNPIGSNNLYKNSHLIQCTSSSMKNQSTALASFKKGLEKRRKKICYGWNHKTNAGAVYPAPDGSEASYSEWFDFDRLTTNTYPTNRAANPDIKLFMSILKNEGNSKLSDDFPKSSTKSNPNAKALELKYKESYKKWVGVVEVNHVKKLSFSKEDNNPLKSIHDFFYESEFDIKNYMTHKWEFADLANWSPSANPDLSAAEILDYNPDLIFV